MAFMRSTSSLAAARLAAMLAIVALGIGRALGASSAVSVEEGQLNACVSVLASRVSRVYDTTFNSTAREEQLVSAVGDFVSTCLRLQVQPTRALRIMVPNTGIVPLLQRHAEHFTSLTGVRVVLNPVSFFEIGAEVRQELMSNLSDFSDGWLIDPAVTGELAALQGFKSLDEYIPEDPSIQWSDFSRFFRQASAIYDGKVVSIPLDGDLLLMYYRRDLFERYGLAVPATWDDFVDLAERMNGTDTDGDGVADLFGVCFDNGPPVCKANFLIIALAAPYLQYGGTAQGLFFDPDTMRPLADNAAMLRAARHYVRLWGLQRKAPSCDASNAEFRAGRCLMTINWGDEFKANALINVSASSSAAFYSNWTSRGWALGVAPLPGAAEVLDRPTGRLVPCSPASSSSSPSSASSPSTSASASSTSSETSRAATGVSAASASQPCPYAKAVRLANGSTALVNYAPYSAFGGWSGAVSAIAPSAYQRRAYEFFAYMAQPNNSWADVLDPSTGIDPYRLSQLETDGANFNRWIAAGYEPAATREYLAAIKEALQSENVVLDARLQFVGLPYRLYYEFAMHNLTWYGSAGLTIEAALASIQQQMSAGLTALGTDIAALRNQYCKLIGCKTDVEASPSHNDSQQKVIIVAAVAATAGGLLLAAAALAALLWRRSHSHRHLLLGSVKPPGAGPNTTLVVTDIESSTTLWELLPEEAMGRAVELHHRIIRSALWRFAGYESATEGDSFICAFHTAADAVRCALHIQQEFLAAPWPPELLACSGCPAVAEVTLTPGARSADTLALLGGGGGGGGGGDARASFTAAAAGGSGGGGSDGKGQARWHSRWLQLLLPRGLRPGGGGAEAAADRPSLSTISVKPGLAVASAVASVLDVGAAATAAVPATTAPRGSGAGVPAPVTPTTNLSPRVSYGQGYGVYGPTSSSSATEVNEIREVTAAEPVCAAAPAAAPPALYGTCDGAAATAARGTPSSRQPSSDTTQSLKNTASLPVFDRESEVAAYAAPDEGGGGGGAAGSALAVPPSTAGAAPGLQSGAELGCEAPRLCLIDCLRAAWLGIAGNGSASGTFVPVPAPVAPVLPSLAALLLATVSTSAARQPSPGARTAVRRPSAAGGGGGGGGGASPLDAPSVLRHAASQSSLPSLSSRAGAAPPPPQQLLRTLTPRRLRDRDPWVTIMTGSGGFGGLGAATGGGGATAAGGRGGVLLFRGLRVRMGMATGVPDPCDVSYVSGEARMHYSGSGMRLARAIQGAAAGGQVLLSDATFVAMRSQPGALGGRGGGGGGGGGAGGAVKGGGGGGAAAPLVLHMGQHVLQEGGGEGAGEATPQQVYQALAARLVGRLALLPPLKVRSTCAAGVLSAPVGHAAVAFMYAAGAESLLAWDAATARRSLALLEAAFAAEVMRANEAGAGGYIVEATGGLLLAAFSDPGLSLACCAAAVAAAPHLPWPPALLEQPLGEELLVPGLGPDGQLVQTVLFRGLRVKVGLDYGTVQASVNAATGRLAYRGRVMNRAARIASKATSGQVLCSRDLWQLAAASASALPRPVSALSAGSCALKGVPEPVELMVCRLDAPAAAAPTAPAQPRPH